MKQECFFTKIQCEFCIITHDEDCKVITRELGLKPSRFFNKGDIFTSKHTSRVGYKPYGLWAIQSEPIISEELNVSTQIKYFQDLLDGKFDILQKFKRQYHFDLLFTISIETEDAGVGLDLSEQELLFITQVSSRYSCTFISKETIK